MAEIAQLRAMDAHGRPSHRFKFHPRGPHCDRGKSHTHRIGSASNVGKFPGGVVQRSFGSSLSKMVFDVTKIANGAAGASASAPLALGLQVDGIGKGLVQSIVSSLVDVLPPLIPPPAWNNMPLPCAPMVTGHNCFGAVLYPITMADFIIADVTDAMLDGYISGFPNTYAEKVGKTSDAVYKACFASYMSMHCSSVFPRCTVPQSRSEPSLVNGRAPMCFHLCILPLVLCPGFWIGDVVGQCQMVAQPPACTQAFFWNFGLLPPQYVSFGESHPFPLRCPPSSDSGISTIDKSIGLAETVGNDASVETEQAPRQI